MLHTVTLVNQHQNYNIWTVQIYTSIYTVIHQKRGSTFGIITLENLDGF